MTNSKTKKANVLQDLIKLCKKHNVTISNGRYGFVMAFGKDNIDHHTFVTYVDKTGAYDEDNDIVIE
jgi:hypothetical protein